MVESAYIHIPFCRQKCKYCSFVSFSSLEKIDAYIKALKKQILLFYSGNCLKTLYFGGGTPSLLDCNQINEIVKLFNFNENAEITIELNPETVDFEYFKKLKDTKINRISIGAQSFDDEILKFIGRKHLSIDIFNAVEYARENGFDNISLDFIYGLPNQTLESFISDLNTAVKLGIEHISLYGLKIDEECYFAKNPPKNIADDELQADMYEGAIEILRKNGFEHYEISNFAKNGKYSRHNINYWQCGEYYGFGVAAHGYENGVRYSNTTKLEDFILQPEKKYSEITLSRQEKLEERIFLGLRLKEGINISKLNKDFNFNFKKEYEVILAKYQKSGHLRIEDDHLCLTKKGILISNYILADFIN